MNDADGNGFSSELKTALRILREEVPVREAWRSSSLERVRESARGSAKKIPPRINPKRWSMRPALAIAAGVACAMAGAAATLAIVRSGEGRKALVASATQSVPVTVSAGVLPVRFSLDAPAATTVSIVGDFNGWDPVALPMRRSADGIRWEVDVVLPPGRYSYAFVVDGRLSPDPRAPRAASDDFGIPNSILMVRGS